MKIKELFQRDITRKIEEVIKVDQAEESTVKNEFEEYIITDSLRDYYSKVLDLYYGGKVKPTEGIGLWISGFFGSGKSSFAKILGYILANREVLGEKTSGLFLKQVSDLKVEKLLEKINIEIPTHAVIFDVSMDRGVKTANERITEVMYKVLLRQLDYAEDFDLAALEISLEEDGLLEDFEKLFEKEYKKNWRKRRKVVTRALNEASNIMHKLDNKTYPQADSWVKSLGAKDAHGNITGRADISANDLAEISFKLMNRRQKGKALIFIIDEVGQYISRSVDKMLDLQAVVQAFGKTGKNKTLSKEAIAPAWIVVTSQEKLNEVVDSLNDKKIELARLQDRFQVRIDLSPADITEVTSKRVLQKKSSSEKKLQKVFKDNEGRLTTCTQLERTSRNTNINVHDFTNLYPYLPYYIDLCVDIMSGIRLQPGAQRHLGGSNRTIIKQAQEMLISPKTNLSDEKVGSLVTLDMVYDLIDGNLSTELRNDINEITNNFSKKHFYVKVAKAICLLQFIKDLPRTVKNISAVLFDSIDSEPKNKDVEEALEALQKANFIRITEEGYKLLTPEGRNWDLKRSGIGIKPADRKQIKKEILSDIFSDHRIRTYRYKEIRNFKIGISVDDENVGDNGDIPVAVHVADDEDDMKDLSKKLRESSRDESGKNIIYWAVSLSDEIHNLILEYHRSRSMIGTYERVAAQNQLNREEATFLSDEKVRKDKIARSLRSKIINSIQNGTAYFRGVTKDMSSLGSELIDMSKQLLNYAVPELFNKLDMGARNLTGKEAEQVLTASNLSGLTPVFYDPPKGLNLVVKKGGKYIPNPSADVAQEIMNYLQQQNSYGEKVTGISLENHFGSFGYGWERDILRLVLAVLLRAGVIEVTYQGQKYNDHSDAGSRPPIINNKAFKAATFAPYVSQISLKILTQAAKNYEAITGNEINIEKGTISEAFKQIAVKEKDSILPLKAKLEANNLPCQETVSEHVSWLEQVINSNVDDCIKLLANEGKTYISTKKIISKLEKALSDKRIKEIQNVHKTLSEKFPILQNLLDTPDSIKEAATELKEALNSETFYDRFKEINEKEKDISEYYKKKYDTCHDKRASLYKVKIDKIKGHSEWDKIPEENKNSILHPFLSRFCESIDYKDMYCNKCNAPFFKIESDINNAESLYSTALQQIEKLLTPEVEIKTIRFSSHVSGTIETEEQLDEALNIVKDVSVKILAEGKKIIFE